MLGVYNLNVTELATFAWVKYRNVKANADFCLKISLRDQFLVAFRYSPGHTAQGLPEAGFSPPALPVRSQLAFDP
jgi:hypothetical protein